MASALIGTIVVSAASGAGTATFIGTQANDTYAGTEAADTIDGRGGNDTLDGRGGNDRINGGPGADSIQGGSGDDRIYTRDGTRDVVACGAGNDTVLTEAGDQIAADCERPSGGGGGGGGSDPGGDPGGDPDGGGGGTPPPVPPTGGGSCSVASTAGCVAGSTLTFTNQTWTCTRPLSSYGALPLRVVMNYTNNLTAFGVRLGAGCVGDASSSSIDLILDIRGNGQTFGTGDDAIRIMNELPGASNIQITGQANCGKKQSFFHQDGVQALGGTNITFVDFNIGNYDAGVATCQGAGGIIFYSGSPRNMNVVRGKFIGCNHGLLDGMAPASGSVVGAMFRTGRFDMATGLCEDGNSGQPYSASPACITSNPMVTQSGLTCQRWNRTTRQWVNQ